MTSTPTLKVSPDGDSLATSLVDWLVARIAGTTGPFALNLCGGSTPKRTYERLASEIYRQKIDWQRIHVFFGDERYVPLDHPDSNFRMAREALLSHVPIPDENVHPVQPGYADPSDAASAYEASLKAFYAKDTIDIARSLFAVTLLGLGADGHTASLFPGTAALEERQRWVTSVVGAKPEPRITMTYPILEASGAVIFLVEGMPKRAILKRVLDGDLRLPAARVQPKGEFYVFCDQAASP